MSPMSPRLLRPRAAGFTPKNISGLVLWLDGSDSQSLYDATSGGSLVSADGAVARWQDKSGNGLHATQSTANNRPLRKTNLKNSLAALRFDGTNDSLQVPSITLPTYITAIVVSSISGSAATLKFWFEHGANVNTSDGMFFNGTYSGAWAIRRTSLHDGPNSLSGTDWIGSGWAIAGFTYDGVGSIYKNSSLVSNATSSGTARSNSNVSAALNIGSRNQSSLFITGDIGEIVIYNRVLSASEFSKIHAELNKKWSVY